MLGSRLTAGILWVRVVVVGVMMVEDGILLDLFFISIFINTHPNLLFLELTLASSLWEVGSG